MALLTDYTSYADAQRQFTSARLWELFEGNREQLNIGHECIDRHAVDPHRVAIRIAHADGRDEAISFRTIADKSSRCAHWLAERGVTAGDRVAIMLEPSLAFYVSLFGVVKLGAIAVPLFTLFGPDGVRSRIDDCSPRLLVTTPGKAQSLGELPLPVIALDDGFGVHLSRYPTAFTPATRADDLAIFQYTSGTTRELPAAIKIRTAPLVVLMNAALMALGCVPAIGSSSVVTRLGSRPVAWHAGSAGAGDRDRRLCRQVQRGASAAGIAGLRHDEPGGCRDALSDDEELRECREIIAPRCGSSRSPANRSTRKRWCSRRTLFGAPLCSMYGTTEVGVVLANYPGAGIRDQAGIARPSGSGRRS